MKKQVDMDQMQPAWRKQPLWVRLNDCRSMLYLHGLITQSQSVAINNKFMKMLTAKKTATKVDEVKGRR
jgi:hypothetical protein